MSVDAFGRCSRCGEQTGTGGCFNLSCISKTINHLQAEIRELKQPKSYGDAGLRSLFKMQEQLPMETGINLAAGIEMGTRITLDYVKKLEAVNATAKTLIDCLVRHASKEELDEAGHAWNDAHSALTESAYSVPTSTTPERVQTNLTPST